MEKKRVGTYRRRSTDEVHQRFTLDAQDDALKYFVKSKGPEWEIVADYADSASGRSMQRENLRRMLRDVEEGKLDIVLVHKIDRLSRRLRDFLRMMDCLSDAGVALVSVTEPIDTSHSTGRIMTSILAAFAEFEADNISERTIFGMDKKARTGKWCGGVVPYGYSYTKEKGILSINPEEKEVVRTIFHLYTEKAMGARTIARWLNGNGYRTRKGKPWSVDAIIRILRNPIYIGKILRKGKVYPGKHKKLIASSTWKNAQAILKERSEDQSLRRSNGSDYYLSGVSRCMRCLGRVVGASAWGRTRKYGYYLCNQRMKHGECDLPRMSKDRLEKAILKQLKEIFGNMNLIKELAERANRKLKKKLPNLKNELERVEKQLKEKEKLADLYFTRFEKGGSLTPLIEKRLRGIGEQCKELEQRKGELLRPMEVGQFQPASVEDIQRAIGHLEEAISQVPPSEVKKLIRLVVKRIDIHSPEHIEPYYRVPMVRVESGLAPRIGRC